MSRKHRIIATSVGLLAIVFALVLTGRLSAGEDDTKAEMAIKALGGRVVRSFATPGRPIISVDFYGAKVTDAGLKELAVLKSLQFLELRGTKVTDAGLKELAGLESLQFLELRGRKVTDAGVKELAGLKSLQSLWLSMTKVTDTGLKELAGLKSLRYLDVAGTKVTDAGVMELRKALPNCTIKR
jgi:hypothetical protein